MSNNSINIALIKKDLDYIKSELSNITHKLDTSYVTQVEFSPIKKIVFGLVALVLTTIGAAIIKLVIIK